VLFRSEHIKVMSWARPSILGRRHVAAPIVLTVLGALSAPVLAAQGAGTTTNAITGRTVVKKLADPAASALGGVAALGSALSPDEELDAALVGLAGASDGAAVARLRQRALDVLEGNPIAGKVWSGIPLLALNGAGKVKTVPAGGSVTVTEVRFGERAISDTAALRFENPSAPFSVVYRVAELGGTMGGLLTPVPLAVGGSGSAAVRQLLSVPRLDTGTTEVNRSHVAGAAEQTRLVVQDVTVAMPAPNAVAAIVDPSMRPGRPSFASLVPATAERVAALDAFGGDRAAAIGRLADVAPAKQLWADLSRLGSSDVAGAHALGVADRALVAGVRSHLGLPAGVAAGAGDLTIALAGNEAFTSHRSRPLAAGTDLVTTINNLDGADHVVTAAAFTGATGRTAYDWGTFSWQALGNPITVPAHTTMAVTIPVPTGTFALWVGDTNSGDQASSIVMDGPVVTAAPLPAPPGPAPVAVPTPPPAPVAPPVVAPAPVPAPVVAPAPAPAPAPKVTPRRRASTRSVKATTKAKAKSKAKAKAKAKAKSTAKAKAKARTKSSTKATKKTTTKKATKRTARRSTTPTVRGSARHR